jgi:hypothetical protein
MDMGERNPGTDTIKTVNNTEISTQTGESTLFQLVTIYAIGDNGRNIPTVADLGLKGEKQPLTIKTVNSNSTKMSSKVSLRIKSQSPALEQILCLPRAWTVGGETFGCSPQSIQPTWEHCKNLDVPDHIDPADVKILIGMDCPEAHLQQEIVRGDEDQPLAVRTTLGWTIMGVDKSRVLAETMEGKINLIQSADQELQQQMERFWFTESFGTKYDLEHPCSTEDRITQEILDNETKLVDGHYQVPMLWRDKRETLPKIGPWLSYVMTLCSGGLLRTLNLGSYIARR